MREQHRGFLLGQGKEEKGPEERRRLEHKTKKIDERKIMF